MCYEGMTMGIVITELVPTFKKPNYDEIISKPHGKNQKGDLKTFTIWSKEDPGMYKIINKALLKDDANLLSENKEYIMKLKNTINENLFTGKGCFAETL